MKRIYYITAIALTALCAVSCELDNYAAPEGCIYGEIIDSGTGEAMPLPVEGNNGAVINLMEVGTKATLAQSFYARHDGSFRDAMVFKGLYSVTADGPFVAEGPYEVEVGDQTELKIYALPYSRIEASASADGMKVTINYKVSPVESGARITTTYVLWNYRMQTDIITGNFCSSKADFTGKAEGSVTINIANEVQYNANKEKIIANGGKVYLRVAADVGGHINYSKVQEVIISE